MRTQSEPTVSIVMPCFNQRRFLSEAVESVLCQPGVNVELLVMDPGSTDGSRDWLKAAEPKYPGRLRLFFQPDNGQSDAVNKGLAQARGQIMGWLNSDDRLRPGALEAVTASLSIGVSDWAYGRCGVIDELGREAGSFVTAYKNFRGRRFSRFKLLQENFISQMAVFWTRALWDEAGGVDVDKHLDMDYDLWLRFSACATPKVLKQYLADFRVHADAKGSVAMAEQLEAARLTAESHAQGLGAQGQVAIGIHRLLSKRTKLLYRFLKPKR